MRRGQSIIELLVAMGLAAILLPALATNLITSTQGKAQQRQRLSAVAFLEEGQEAVRSARERSWSTVSQDGTYYALISGQIWTLTPTVQPLLQGLFSRTIVISSVARDNTTKAIVAVGSPNSTVDPSTKQVVIIVSWTTPYPSSVSSTAYLTRQQNVTWTQTTYSDFSAGSPSSMAKPTTSSPPSPAPTTFPGDGEVDLGAGSGGSDWCQPNLSLTALDLDGQGVTTALSAIPGHAYATTGNNASGHALYTVSITDPPQSPSPAPTPVATQGPFYDPTPSRKGYGLYAEPTGQYVFVTTNKHTVNIVKTSDLTEAGYYDNGKQGVGVFSDGTSGFVTTTQSNLISFQASPIQANEPQKHSVAIGGVGQKVIVIGTHVYVVTDSTTDKFKIFNSSDLSQVNTNNSGISALNNNGQSGVDFFVNSSETDAYVVTKYSATGPDFFVIDLSNKSSPNIIGSYTTQHSMSPNAVTIVPSGKAIVVGTGGADLYQVLNIQSMPPTRCETSPMTFPSSVTSINAISSVNESDGDAFSYILTNNASGEFQMIQGGPGSAVSTSGTFTSSTFDPCTLGYCNGSTFNWLSADVTQPLSGGNQVQLQVAVATPIPSTNSCSGVTFTYLGPLGTTTDYFQNSTQGTSQIAGQIPLAGPGTYRNPGRCFSYKAVLSTTDLTKQPSLYDVNVNYSP